MNQNQIPYQVLPFPMERQVTIQGGRLASRKHTIYALIEVDVTEPRRMIREYKARTGETLSFTAFVIACLGRAIDQNRRMHAYRDWRNRLIVFEEVDVNTMIEMEADGRKKVIPHWVRAANKRTLQDIHAEIRTTQAKPEQTRESGVKWLGLLPAFAWDIFFWFIFRNPLWLKKSFGTVGMTSVGMFGKGSGWAIPFGLHTLDVALGGIAEKPGVIEGRIEIREYLCLTVCFDHDIVDGAPAARFTQRLKELVESSYGLTDLVAEGERVQAWR
ncbi:MAG TPA: 2-oxo acid dehydrogenase subunit E2 [Anaerolineales bacterium]|nr:2-oxo acid dehydrogenase subunit E2 [Anaerolineales bacterium]